MSVLSNVTIAKRGGLVAPYQGKCVQPSSYDVHLGGTLLRMPYGVTIDPEQDQSALLEPVPLREDGRWMLGQHALYLGVTLERITVPNTMVGYVHGLSSLGRLGLLVHCTAGLIDAGWEGPITLEVVSLGGHILLRPGQRIAQITWHLLDTPAGHTYNGRYVDAGVLPEPSRAWKDVTT